MTTFSLKNAPVAAAFYSDRLRHSMIMGPIGCLAGDSKVITSRGLKRIDSLNHKDLVLSWSESRNRFELSSTSGGFPKGREKLYRVVMQKGEWRGAAHHRVLCVDGKYRQVSELCRGHILFRYSSALTQTKGAAFPLSSPSSVHRWIGTLAGLKDRCSALVRQYGLQLRSALISDRVFSPSHPGVPTRDHSCSSAGHIHQGQSSFLRGTDDSLLLPPHLSCADGSYVSASPSEHIVEIDRQWMRSLLRTSFRLKARLFAWYSGSYLDSLHEGVIISVERCEKEEVYWDCQVANNHNYVTEDGCIHHNSGKSVASIQKIIRIAGEQEPMYDSNLDCMVRKTRWAVIRNTYKQLEDTTILTWLDWFPSPQWGRFQAAPKNNYLMQWVGVDDVIVQCEVRFRALDRPDQVDNLLSAEYTGGFFNEARHADKDIFDVFDGRIGRYPPKKDVQCTWMGILMDTNPPDKDHWLYELFEEKRPKNAKAFYQPSGLSPEAENIEYLPDLYYENIVETKDEYYIHVYVHGKYGFLRTGKPVYPEYNDKVHCDPSIEALPNIDLRIGLDFGLTPACVICQPAPNGQLLVIDEVTSDRAGIKQFLEVVLPYIAQTYPDNPIDAWYCDPAGNQGAQTDMKTPFDVMYDEGITPEEGQQDPDVRIESVKQLLNKMIDGSPAIVISHRCKLLRKGFNGSYAYRRMKVSKKQYSAKPDKADPSSHVHDGLQYLCSRMMGNVSGKVHIPRVLGGMKHR